MAEVERNDEMYYVKREDAVGSDIKIFGNYRCAFVDHCRSDAKNLVISMASRQLEPDGPFRYEWSNSLNKLSVDSAVLYVMDRSNSWYTDRDGWSELNAYIADLQDQHAIERTVCLGLSMGGYGSLLLSSSCRIDRVVAMATQTCIGRSAPFDPRFQLDWQCLGDDAVTDAAHVMPSGCEYVLCTPCDDLIDVAHLAKFQAAVPEAVCLVVQGGHHFSELRATSGFHRLLASLLSYSASAASKSAAVIAPELPRCIADFAMTTVGGRPDVATEAYLSHIARVDRFFSVHYLQQIWRDGQVFPARRHQNLLVHHSDRYLTKGWSSQESWGRWAVDVEHVVSFKSVDFDDGETLFLSIDFIVFGRSGTRQRLRFSSADREVYDLMQPCNLQDSITVLVPIFSPDVTITIWTPDAVSPKTLDETSMDDRMLSIGILSMHIVSASDLN